VGLIEPAMSQPEECPQNRPERSHPSRVVPVWDRGERFADRDGRCHGATLYDEQVRVPFIIYVPGLTRLRWRAGMSGEAHVAVRSR